MQGVTSCWAQIISTSGYQGLYRGLEPALVGTTVSQGVYFYLYSKLRSWALQALQGQGKALTGDIGVGPSLLVAFLAGCGNVLLTNPIWVVSTRMQVLPCCTPCRGPLARFSWSCAAWRCAHHVSTCAPSACHAVASSMLPVA